MVDLGIPIYDLVMGAVVLFSIVYGMSRGFIWQLASLSSLILSCWAAVRWSPALARIISHQEPWNRWVAMLLIFVFCSLIVWLIFQVVGKWLRRVHLEGFDRQMGAVFGLLKGILICLVITFFSVTLFTSTRSLVLTSRSGPIIARLIPKVAVLLPKEIRTSVGEYLDEFETQIQAPPPDSTIPDN